MQQQWTELSQIGEFGLIHKLTNNIVLKQPSTIKGVGDDAAVLLHGSTPVVVTTDLLIEGVHFDLTYVPLKHLGYKSVIVNLSDVFAMNATPTQITVSIAVSNRFSLELLQELYAGIHFACEQYGVDLVGGDTSSSQKGLVISITAIGTAALDKIVYRSTAQPNQIICVSGDLGAAYLGLQLLEREKLVFNSNPDIQPELTGNDYILQRQLRPEARQDIVAFFDTQHIKPTSMIDVSDGLSSEMIHICKASNVGCKIFEDRIPINSDSASMAYEFNLDPTICALSGGEDYELLFTLALADYEKVKDDLEAAGISVIGHTTSPDEGINLVTRDNTQVPLTAQGWDAWLKVDVK